MDDTSSTAERVDESAARGSLLEEIADGVPLSLRLEHLVRSVEQLAPGVVGSLLLISDGQLRVAAAPSLPEGYHRIADHQLIAGETAAHRRETVIASDLQTDPRWKNYRDVARAYGLGACWSAPILNRRQEVVGTLALYSREPRRPREEELAVIREFSALAAVTIEQQRLEDRLRDSLTALQELVDELAGRASLALETARRYEEAQEAVQHREEFLSIAAHELRNPLSGLHLINQTVGLQLDEPELDRELLRSRARAAERQIRRMTRLINDLLDVSMIRAGHMQLSPQQMDLVEATHSVTARFQDELRTKEMTVVVHGPEPVWGWWDLARIDQVITNLLSNAIKYGEGRPVRVVVQEGNAKATLRIEDQGMGIPDEVKRRLFRPFERGVAAGRYAGLGLGLYITAQIVHAHGGTISVESGRKQGTTFVVEVPLTDALTREPVPPR